MYDVYRHTDSKGFLLTVFQGAKLPERASVAKWMLLTKRAPVPKIVRDEIRRSGYCVTKPKPRLKQPE